MSSKTTGSSSTSNSTKKYSNHTITIPGVDEHGTVYPGDLYSIQNSFPTPIRGEDLANNQKILNLIAAHLGIVIPNWKLHKTHPSLVELWNAYTLALKEHSDNIEQLKKEYCEAEEHCLTLYRIEYGREP